LPVGRCPPVRDGPFVSQIGVAKQPHDTRSVVDRVAIRVVQQVRVDDNDVPRDVENFVLTDVAFDEVDAWLVTRQRSLSNK
jgi:hypothetical protein